MSKLVAHRKKSLDAPKGPLFVGTTRITRDMLTKGQKGADEVFGKWYFSKKSKKNQILRIGGGAGSGKTFFLQYLIDKYGFEQDTCYVMAYTGQAVSVLRQNGVLGNTIHSTITYPKETPIIDKRTGKPIYKRGIPLTRLTFVPVKSLPASVKLLVIDEASFLPKELEDILKGYNIPILEIGDPIQLPPVASQQVFTLESLDYFIDGVMRQNVDSEIYDLATRLRMHKNVNTAKYHKDVRFLYAQPTIEETFYRFLPFFRDANIIIVSTNKQRQIITDLYRKEILKTDSPYPIAGEKMICRKNNRALTLDQFNLANGTIGISMDDVGRSQVDKRVGTFFMDFKPDVVADTDLYYDNLMCDSHFLKKPYGESDELGYKRPGEKFEYAHAITCHLAQGGQFNRVIYMDAFNGDPDYLARIRYTAVTRAREMFFYIIPHTDYPGWCDLRNIEEREAGMLSYY